MHAVYGQIKISTIRLQYKGYLGYVGNLYRYYSMACVMTGTDPLMLMTLETLNLPLNSWLSYQQLEKTSSLC